MIFADVIEQILVERGIDRERLASELAIPFEQVEKIYTGEINNPEKQIIDKIMQYCEKYGIVINWNEIQFEQQKTMWDERLIIDTAKKYGFSVEDKDSLWCSTCFPAMTSKQFALICDDCFHSEIFDKQVSSVQKIIDHALKHRKECEGLEDCLIKSTNEQNIIWIPDVECIMAILPLSINNKVYLEIIEKVKNKEVYVSSTQKKGDKEGIYLFYHYYTDENNCFNFLIHTSVQFANMKLYVLPKEYTDRLYKQIKVSMNQDVVNMVALQKSCDEYIDMCNYIENQNQNALQYANILKEFQRKNTLLVNSFNQIPQAEGILSPYLISVAAAFNNQRQHMVERILSMQHCPVCHSLHNSKAKTCVKCGFDELNKTFINKDESELWFTEVVLPAREKYEKNK